MPPSEPALDLPTLEPQLARIEEMLARQGELGLVSVSIVRTEGEDSQNKYWQEYEATLRETSAFLIEFSRCRLRRTDVLLEPMVSGNTFVVLLDPPRKDRSLDASAIACVRHRLACDLRSHLGRGRSAGSVLAYGVCVGGSLLRHDAGVDSSRIVYLGLEEAFADALRQGKREKLGQAVQLHGILKSGEVNTVYQPVVDVVERVVLGFEALTRVPGGHFPRPDLMFRVAQENGVLWELERLCRKRALDALPEREPHQKLFLNVEPESFHDPRLLAPSFLADLECAGLEPSKLVLELTEHAAVRDFGALRRTLDDVRAVGYRLALDDVGSGHSGLQAIAEIRPDYLKMDMALVRNLHLDPIKHELISTIRRFAENTGVTLVAEGVESRQELASLSVAGVRCAQGFLFARPDSPPESPNWGDLDDQ